MAIHSNPHILISIINYKTAEMTIAAAASARAALGERAGQVVVVDNASGDGSVERLSDWIAQADDPKLHLVVSETNSGFSGGHNQGMAVNAEADFYLILNSDALLPPDFFDTLLPATEATPQVGLFGPQLEGEDGTVQNSCFRFHTPASEVIRAAGTGPVTRALRHRVVALEPPVHDADIEWISFACVLLRGEMVRAIGPMDEGYFLYFEDSEYGMRARRAGWHICYVPAARTVHFQGGSGEVVSGQAARKRLPAYYWRARTRFLRQAHGPFGPLWGNLGWIAGRCIARVRLLTGRRVAKAHDNEWRDIWQGFSQPLRPDKAP